MVATGTSKSERKKKLIIDQHDQGAEFMTIYVLRSL